MIQCKKLLVILLVLLILSVGKFSSFGQIGPEAALGGGLSLLQIEGRNVLTAQASVKIPLCTNTALLIEVGQGALGWRAGDIRFLALSTVVYLFATPRLLWYIDYGLGYYQCPCVGEDIFASLSTGIETSEFGVPIFAHFKLTNDRGLRRVPNLSYIFSIGIYMALP